MNEEEWAELHYQPRIHRLSLEEGGGYHATYPTLGEGMFVGDGDTVEEALLDLEARRRRLLPDYLELGIPIPPPDNPTVTLKITQEELVLIYGALKGELGTCNGRKGNHKPDKEPEQRAWYDIGAVSLKTLLQKIKIHIRLDIRDLNSSVPYYYLFGKKRYGSIERKDR